MYTFGVGSLYGIPTIDYNGNAVTTPTPIQFGVLQDVTMDFSRAHKELIGQYAFPVAVGAGTGKITGKAKHGLINGAILNLMFGTGSAVQGEQKASIDEAGTIPGTKAAASVSPSISPSLSPSTATSRSPSVSPSLSPSVSPSTYIVTVGQSANFLTDLGVKYGNNGRGNQDAQPMVRVPLSPGTTGPGQYTVANGVYTFNAADQGLNVTISYLYTTGAYPGAVYTVSNPLIGHIAYFKMVWTGSFQGKTGTFTLNRCLSSKLTLNIKLEDFLIPEFDFSAMADDNNVLWSFSVANG